MKLLYVAPRYHTNQVPIMRGWAERGDEVTFCAQYEGISEVHDYVNFMRMKESWLCRLWFKIIDKRCSPVEAEDKKIRAFIPSVFETSRLVRSIKPDVVILRNRSIATFTVYWICKLMGIKNIVLYIQTPYEQLMDEKRSFKWLLKQMLFPNVIFTPIMYRGKRIATEKIAPHVHYIPFVSNLAEGENRRYCPDNCLRILDVGKYRDYKNHFYLIEALAPLKDRKDIRVTVIGQVSNSDERQYFEKLEQAVHLAELDSMVTLRENVSYRFMHQVYQEHDILVLPSKFESAGMAILEAMAEKMGVICSNNCGLPDHVESNNCGITFPLDNAEKLTEIIVKIADNKSIVERMGDNAAKAVNSQFSFENYFSSFMDMLRKEFKFDMKDVNPG